MADARARTLVAKSSRMLYGAGLATDVGHVGIRSEDGDSVFVNPLMASRGAVRPEDVVEVDMDSEPLDPEQDPVGEVEIHTGLLRAREDLDAVIHSHPPHATLFGMTGTELRPVYFRSARSMGTEPIPVFEEPGLISTRAESGRMVDAMDGHTHLLIRGHGAVVGGRTIEEAFFHTLLLEENATFQLYASILGNPNVLHHDEVEASAGDGMSQVSARKFWGYHEWKARTEGYIPADW